MIYEERLTFTYSKSAEEYLKYCQSDRLEQLSAAGGQTLCLLSGLIGDPANQYLQITAFEDVRAWEEAQAFIGPK